MLFAEVAGDTVLTRTVDSCGVWLEFGVEAVILFKVLADTNVVLVETVASLVVVSGT